MMPEVVEPYKTVMAIADRANAANGCGQWKDRNKSDRARANVTEGGQHIANGNRRCRDCYPFRLARGQAIMEVFWKVFWRSGQESGCQTNCSKAYRVSSLKRDDCDTRCSPDTRSSVIID